MNNKQLEEKIIFLEKRIANLENYIATLDNVKSLNKPLEEKIIDTIIKSVFQHYYVSYTDEKALIKTQVILDQTGFVSLDIDGSKAFIYALHPSKFIKDHNLWNFVQQNIKNEYNKTLCIGLFEIDKSHGRQIFKKFEDAFSKFKKRSFSKWNIK